MEDLPELGAVVLIGSPRADIAATVIARLEGLDGERQVRVAYWHEGNRKTEWLSVHELVIP
jgi:hypothetical protein